MTRDCLVDPYTFKNRRAGAEQNDWRELACAPRASYSLSRMGAFVKEGLTKRSAKNGSYAPTYCGRWHVGGEDRMSQMIDPDAKPLHPPCSLSVDLHEPLAPCVRPNLRDEVRIVAGFGDPVNGQWRGTTMGTSTPHDTTRGTRPALEPIPNAEYFCGSSSFLMRGERGGARRSAFSCGGRG